MIKRNFLFITFLFLIMSALFPCDAIAASKEEVIYNCEDVIVKYSVYDEWETGYNVKVIINNGSKRELTGWELDFICNGTVRNYWNAEMKKGEINDLELTSKDWNNTVKPNETVEIGMTIDSEDSNLYGWNFIYDNQYASLYDLRLGDIEEIVCRELEDSSGAGSDEYCSKLLNYDGSSDLIESYVNYYKYCLEMGEKSSVCSSETFKNKTLREIKDEMKEIVNAKNKKNTLKIKKAKNSLDLDKAINYARLHAGDDKDGTYKYYKDGDCTNFVSQILHAAGKGFTCSNKKRNETNLDFNQWYHYHGKDYTAVSASFIRVKYFATHLNNTMSVRHTKYNKESDVVKNAHKGDIILILDSITDTPSHAIFVTDKSKNDLKYCGHTRNRLDASFINNCYSNHYMVYHIFQ